MKKCTVCGIKKSYSEFHKGNSPDGLRAACKVCTRRDNNFRCKRKNYHKKRSYFWSHELHHQHKTRGLVSLFEKRRNYNLLSRYGISLSEYNRLLEKQNGVCAICGRGPGKRSLHVDHCHKTGKVRALLCTHCNTTIGYVSEDINILRGVIKYLELYLS